ncbi:EAL domain-containing protein [Neobacillus sp. YIM B02564]|uniref:EAL domain-containing protein n=1 Tax=Neobacillus paridis TaxID=2803862 RepID=A0ABS1TLI0_9BACI|nr:EAL domain-containing protein [Neobacillus paridis]
MKTSTLFHQIRIKYPVRWGLSFILLLEMTFIGIKLFRGSQVNYIWESIEIMILMWGILFWENPEDSQQELKQALKKKEFVLFYQPKIDVKTKQIVGMEALIRWHHPKKGLLSPIEFIPLAEKTGLIVPIGNWALKEACWQNIKWQQEGHPPLRVAVNISPKQLAPDLVQTIKDILEETGLSSECLEIEVTEGMLIELKDSTKTIIEEIRKLGVTVSLDDFGTGYSNIQYLQSFHVDSLKIDRSFIQNIETSPINQRLAEIITQMAHSLNLSVVAEGVETKEQYDFLQSIHCDEIQGYYVGKPASVKEFSTLFFSQTRP